ECTDPRGWLFPGDKVGGHIGKCTIDEACQKTRRRCRIPKPITPHSLRHYLPFLTMSGNGEPLRIWFGDFRSRPAKPSTITRHSMMPVTDCSGRRGVDRQVYSDPALHAAGMS